MPPVTESNVSDGTENARRHDLDTAMPRWQRLLREARSPLGIVLILTLALSGWYFFPKKQALSAGYDGVAYYRGFGLMDGDSMLGRRFYAADFTYEHELDYWYTKYEVHYRGGDRAYFKGYYKNGVIAYEGECSITFFAQGQPSDLDLMGGSWAKYYRPDGFLGGEVINGTGVHDWWTQDGAKISEIAVKDGLTLYRTWWYPSGQLRMHHTCDNGAIHGEWKSYWPNGRLSHQATYHHGQRVGPEISYNEDGTVEKEIVHPAP